MPDALLLRHAVRGARGHRVGLAHRRGDDPDRRPRHGRDRLRLPDRGWALLLVRKAFEGQLGRMELVHWMVQPARAGSGDGRHRLRLCHVLYRFAQHDRRLPEHGGPRASRLCRDPDRARRPEHFWGPDRRFSLGRERVVARDRRARDRRRCSSSSRATTHRCRSYLPSSTTKRRSVCRSTCSCSGATDGPVHLHRLRRFRPFVRGNPQRRPGGTQRHCELDSDLSHCRLGPDPGHYVGDPDKPAHLCHRAAQGSAPVTIWTGSSVTGGS